MGCPGAFVQGRFSTPLAVIVHAAANHVVLVPVDGGVEVDRVGIVDGGAVDDGERVAKRWACRVLVKGALDGTVREAHQVAVALGQVARILGSGHEFGLVDGVSGLLEACHHVIPGVSQVRRCIAAGPFLGSVLHPGSPPAAGSAAGPLWASH